MFIFCVLSPFPYVQNSYRSDQQLSKSTVVEGGAFSMDQQHIAASSSTSSPRAGLGWSIGGSVFASLCCLSPVVAILFGLSGASFLFALPQYRIPLLLAGLGFSGIGVWMALRQSKQTCSLEQHRRNQWLFPATMLSVFLVGYAILTYGVPALVYNSLDPSAANGAPAAPVAAPENRVEQPKELSQPDAQAPLNAAAPKAAEPVRSQAEGAPAVESRSQSSSAGPHRAELAISGMT
jgi:hypothetical protein